MSSPGAGARGGKRRVWRGRRVPTAAEAAPASEGAMQADAAFAAALASLDERDQLRLAGWRLCGSLLADPPSAEQLSELRESKAVETLAGLAERVASPAATALRFLGEWLAAADAAQLEAARRDGQRLFLTSRHLPAPPWESVYTSPDRLVLQEAARDALQAYAEAGFIFDGWKSRPADHVSLELDFAATLLARSSSDKAAAEQLARFEQKHLGWIPRFCSDLLAAAESPLYRHIATALSSLVKVSPRR
jgi:putative dimethyl sulfoxide reductase chaperone